VSDDSTENRVFLFRGLAEAWLMQCGSQLSSHDDEDRARAVEALAEIARVSCIVADRSDLDADAVRDLILGDEGGDALDDDAPPPE
jgi:hypothetical protein